MPAIRAIHADARAGLIVHTAGTDGFHRRFPPEAGPRHAPNGTRALGARLPVGRNTVSPMTIAEQQLMRLGFATDAEERPCWRTTRVDGPSVGESAADPAQSRALMRWRVLLARNLRRSPYRISRIED